MSADRRRRRLRILALFAGVAAGGVVTTSACGTRSGPDKEEVDARGDTLGDGSPDAVVFDGPPCTPDALCLGPLPPPDLPA